MIFFDNLENRYSLYIEIKLITPLHIGSGSESLSPLDSDNSVMKGPDGTFILPGSSIKGVFRSTVENLLRSINEKSVCDIENEPCLKKARKDFNNNEEWYEYIEKNLCEACSLFGSQSTSSHVYFSDAISNDGNASNRDGIRINRGSETAAFRAKYDFELVNPGATFKGEIVLENVDDYQLGYILRIIDLVNNGFIRFGGKKSAGLGRVEISYKGKYLDKNNVFSSGQEIENYDKYYNALKERIDSLKKVRT